MGVSGAACVGCLGCYWVKEAGDSRVPLLAAQRALSSFSIKVKSSAPLPPPWSGPVAVATDRSRDFRKAQMYNWRGHHSCCKWVLVSWVPALEQYSFLNSNALTPSPIGKESLGQGMTQAMSSSSPAQETSEPVETYPWQEGAPASLREQMRLEWSSGSG